MEHVTHAIGNPTSLLIERIFWFGLGVFLVLALITSLLRGGSNESSNNKIKTVSPKDVDNLAKKAFQKNSDCKWFYLFRYVYSHNQIYL